MKPHRSLILIAAALTTSAFAGSLTNIENPTPTAIAPQTNTMNSDLALGDWGGLRSDIANSGVTFDSYYVMNPAGNVSGGKGQGFSYVDNFYLGINFDLEKLFGWDGLTFAISGINRSGGSVSEAYVGSQYDVQQVNGGQNIFFYNLTLEQKFWNDKARFKIGRFGASDDFNTSPIYGLFMNNGIDGNIRNVLFDTQFSAYPFATWAARLRLDPTPEINFQIGVFQTWDDIFDRTHNGLDWSIHNNDGVMLLAQLGWTPKFDSKPGHYWIGGSYSPWKGFTQFGKTEKTSGSYGIYAHADQMVYQESPESDQGLTLFVASGYYPQENISIIPWQLNLGGFYTGLLPGRPNDKTILGLIHGRFSSDYSNMLEAAGNGKPTQETVVELGYRIQLTKYAYIQPDIQYVSRPGGSGRIGDAIIVGAQIGITF